MTGSLRFLRSTRPDRREMFGLQCAFAGTVFPAGRRPITLKPISRFAPALSIRPRDRAQTFAAQVRDLFNHRAVTWGKNYKPQGKLTWRLHQFGSVLREFALPPAESAGLWLRHGSLAKHLWGYRYVVTACDVADQMIASARRVFGDTDIQWKTLPADWCRLPFLDRSFDAVVASCVLGVCRRPGARFQRTFACAA